MCIVGLNSTILSQCALNILGLKHSPLFGRSRCLFCSPQAIPELVKMHQRLTRWYRDLVLLNYSDPDMKEFVGTFKSIREEGKHTIALSASGIYKLRKRLNKFSQQETNFFDDWLDGFLLSRTRMDYNVCRRCMDTFGFYAVVTCLSESRGLLILIPEKSTRLSVLCEITI